ncbi:efflux RND transporter periplasmic adaptor subunit [Armatimonas sp.]|uniref:efflux RND transporter periplasmic adaptor subunit n=1 Tax=Armatimonas sp. TaxID=1872638 RepID=UPI0037507DA2
MLRKLISIVVALAVLGGGGYFLSKRLAGASAAAQKTQYKLGKAETGSVKKTVSSSGTLQAWKVVDIKARAGGELTYLGVDIGSKVTTGQLLARIDPLDVQTQLNLAKADERSALARRDQSQKTWQLQVAQSKISVRDAQVSVRSAEATLSASQANLAASKARLLTSRQQAETQPALTNSAIANAQASYDQAKVQREQLDSTTQQLRAAADAAYKQAIANRDNARLLLDRQKALVERGFVSQQAVDSARASLEVAEATLTSAKIKQDTVGSELRGSLESADARVAQTKAALDQAQAGIADISNRKNSVLEAEASVKQTEAAVKQSEAALMRAKVALDQARTNIGTNDVRHYDVDTNNSSIVRATASRTNAETTLQRTEIRSPMGGVVLAKTVEQGTIIASAMGISSAGASMMTIGDTSRMYVDVVVDETDVANVDEGQKVDVSVEAYPGTSFEGKVIRVDPQAVVNQNVTSVHVRVEVDNSTPTFQLLKPGMNTTCQFVVKEVSNVLVVSNDAIKDDDDGTKYVEKATGGKAAPPDATTGIPAEEGTMIDVKITKAKVEVGTVGNDTTEITSGLVEGDSVVTQTIEPEPPKAAGGSPFANNRGMGGGGGRR